MSESGHSPSKVSADAQRLFEDYCESLPDDERPELAGAFSFGDSRTLADTLVDLVYMGEKTATAPAKWTLEANDESIPEPGDHWVVLDGKGEPRCVIQTTDVEEVPFADVSADHATAEGEGDGSLAYWRETHLDYYRRTLPEGRSFDREIPVVCERFKIVYCA
ncbi:ASCH domain-containing protein [Halorubrum halophilum]|uniref:ASCH domain-containing protein n=1 Tax=Halorubrum halophilum TaxID=413816 RepID=UPI00186B0398|nr:ASCH domain-containing protein [Halorubrum halophilum]